MGCYSALIQTCGVCWICASNDFQDLTLSVPANKERVRSTKCINKPFAFDCTINTINIDSSYSSL